MNIVYLKASVNTTAGSMWPPNSIKTYAVFVVGKVMVAMMIMDTDHIFIDRGHVCDICQAADVLRCEVFTQMDHGIYFPVCRNGHNLGLQTASRSALYYGLSTRKREEYIARVQITYGITIRGI